MDDCHLALGTGLEGIDWDRFGAFFSFITAATADGGRRAL
jgi:hypothetical protein